MTDVLIKNGDTVFDSAGRPVLISSTRAKLQRALICVCARLGSFVYNRELGSELYKVSKTDDRAAQKAELVSNEALASFENTSVRVTEFGDKIKMAVTADGETIMAEVDLYGNI